MDKNNNESVRPSVIIATPAYNEEKYLGYYLTALVNNIIRPHDTITLHLNNSMYALGAGFSRGNLVLVKNDNYPIGDKVGFYMSGGNLKVVGHTGDSAGCFMSGGNIHITGHTGYHLGDFTLGGLIRVDGNICHISEGCQASVFNRDKLIWPKTMEDYL